MFDTHLEDPADVLCRLHDTWVDQINVDHLRAAAKRRGQSEALAQRVLAAGGVDVRHLRVANATDAAVALIGLDLVLGEARTDIGTAKASAQLPELVGRLAATGKFNDKTGGALLPKRSHTSRPKPPNYLRDALVHVTRISPPVWAKIHFVRVHPGDDLPGPVDELMLFATLPMSDTLEDFHIGPAGEGGYHLGPVTERYPMERLVTALGALDATGATVAVLPEGTIDPEIVARWRQVCVENPNDASALQWILIGSGPDEEAPPHNRAVLLNRRTGEVLAKQDKRNPFTLTPQYIKSYGLNDQLPEEVDHDEAILVGTTLTVIESRAGRFCICICEDLTRLVEDAALFLELGPSHVLVPVFGKEIEKASWPDLKADEFGQKIGASVIVVTSQAILRAREAADPKGSFGQATSLAYRYLGDHRHYPKQDLRDGKATGPLTPELFEIHPRPSQPVEDETGEKS